METRSKMYSFAQAALNMGENMGKTVSPVKRRAERPVEAKSPRGPGFISDIFGLSPQEEGQ